MSITGDILEETGDAVEALLAGAVARYQQIELPGMTQDQFIFELVFETLCGLHNRATRDQICHILTTRIY